DRHGGRIGGAARVHAQRAVDVGGIDIVAVLEAAIERIERAARLLGLFARPADGHVVAARRNADIEALLDLSEMAVVAAEQLRQERVVVEFKMQRAAFFDIRPQTLASPWVAVAIACATGVASSPPRLTVCAAAMRTSRIWPKESSGTSAWTG